MADRIFEDLGMLARAFDMAALRTDPVIEAVAAESAVVLYEHVIKVMGDASKLQPLAPSTQAERVAHGYTPNDPLVRSGELLHSQEVAAEGHVAGVGTQNPIMVYQEFGTPKIPPRPTYKIALNEALPEVFQIALKAGPAVLDGARGHTQKL